MKAMMFLAWMLYLNLMVAPPNIAGKWFGTITQNEGGYRAKYDFELYLHQNGTQITGRSYVYVEKIYAEMTLKGQIQADGSVKLTEINMLDFKEFEGMEWCIKAMKLKLNRSTDTWTLEGDWEGKTSFSSCTPGKVFLKKIIPRA